MRLIDQRRGVPAQVKRIEQTLNKPIVVLVVGVIAVALNVLLYFGYFLPRTAPLVEQIYSIGTSLPEAISSGSETGSGSDPEASGTSGSEASGESETDSSPASAQDSPSGSPATSSQPQQQSAATPQTPAGSPPPELPPLPTPAEMQYQ
jgi:hypothetical protein